MTMIENPKLPATPTAIETANNATKLKKYGTNLGTSTKQTISSEKLMPFSLPNTPAFTPITPQNTPFPATRELNTAAQLSSACLRTLSRPGNPLRTPKFLLK
jgi:hypothetical protein